MLAAGRRAPGDAPGSLWGGDAGGGGGTGLPAGVEAANPECAARPCVPIPGSEPMNPLHGIALKLVSVVLFVVMQSLVKAAGVPPGQATFFRSFFALPVILVWLAASRQLGSGIRVVHPLGHLWRGLVGTGAMAFGFAALAHLPLPEVMALGYTAPLLTVIFAALFLGETVRAFRFACVAAGMAGVLIVLSPRLTGIGTPEEAMGAAFALAGAVCSAGAMVTVRALVLTESTSAIVFWFSAIATVLSLATIPFGWAALDGMQAAMLVMAGLLGGVAQIFLTASYRHADASVVAPFDYASMILALAIGWLVFAEVPTLTMLAGATLIVGAGIVIIWRERQLGIERRRQRQAIPGAGA